MFPSLAILPILNVREVRRGVSVLHSTFIDTFPDADFCSDVSRTVTVCLALPSCQRLIRMLICVFSFVGLSVFIFSSM